MSFIAVFIPCSPAESMREEVFSVDGGLEQDALRLSADAYFAAKAANITTAAVAKQREDIYEMLSKQEGFDVNSAKTQEMIDSLQGKSANAGSEIIVVSCPTPANDFVGVSLYCDRSAQMSDQPPNARATSIAQFCGHKTVVYGDCYFGRYHDDERVEWKRLDFKLSDVNSDAEWLIKTQAMNKGKNLGSMSTSGQFQNILNNQQQIKSSASASASASASNSAAASSTQQLLGNTKTTGNTTWSETSDEVEVTLKLIATIKKSDIKVSFLSKALKITINGEGISKNLLRNAEEMSAVDSKICDTDSGCSSSNGLELRYPIDTSCSTWTLEQGKDGAQLLVSLSKRDEGLTCSWKHSVVKAKVETMIPSTIALAHDMAAINRDSITQLLETLDRL